MMKEHDVEARSVPYIEKGQKLGVIRSGDALTFSVLFYSSIQRFAETLVARDELKLPDKEWFYCVGVYDRLGTEKASNKKEQDISEI